MFFIYQFENNQMLKRVQHDNMDLALVFVIPNQVLNHALNQVQDLTISGSRFWIERI